MSDIPLNKTQNGHKPCHDKATYDAFIFDDVHETLFIQYYVYTNIFAGFAILIKILSPVVIWHVWCQDPVSSESGFIIFMSVLNITW